MNVYYTCIVFFGVWIFESHDLEFELSWDPWVGRCAFEQLVFFFLDSELSWPDKRNNQVTCGWWKVHHFCSTRSMSLWFAKRDLSNEKTQSQVTRLQGQDCQVSCIDCVSTWQIQGSSKWPGLIPLNGGHFSPQKVTYRSKRGHFEEAGPLYISRHPTTS